MSHGSRSVQASFKCGRNCNESGKKARSVHSRMTTAVFSFPRVFFSAFFDGHYFPDKDDGVNFYENTKACIAYALR